MNTMFALLAYLLSSRGPSVDGFYFALSFCVHVLARRRLDDHPAARRRAVKYLEVFLCQILTAHDKGERMPKFTRALERDSQTGRAFGKAIRCIRNDSKADPVRVLEILAARSLRTSGDAQPYSLSEYYIQMAVIRSGGAKNLKAIAKLSTTREFVDEYGHNPEPDFDPVLAMLIDVTATDEQLADAVDMLLREPQRLIVDDAEHCRLVSAGLKRAYLAASSDVMSRDIMALVLKAMNLPHTEQAHCAFDVGGTFTVEGALYRLFHFPYEALETDDSLLSSTLLELPREVLEEGLRWVITNVPPELETLLGIPEPRGTDGIIASAYYATQRGDGELRVLADRLLSQMKPKDWEDSLWGVRTILCERFDFGSAELMDLNKTIPERLSEAV